MGNLKVNNLEPTLGPIDEKSGISYQWLFLNAKKINRQNFSVEILSSAYPAAKTTEAHRQILKLKNQETTDFEYQQLMRLVEVP